MSYGIDGISRHGELLACDDNRIKALVYWRE
jgi:hypothetical protein